MDTETIFCKLCKSNHADKTNSHIVPKFLTKEILGTNGPRVGHLLDTSTPFNKPIKSQDSPKEDNILCMECEKYFEVLETYIADRIARRYGISKYADNFTVVNNGYGVNYAICEEVSPIIMKLFVYSIFWRCSISQATLFLNFNLKPSEEELLRRYLIEYRSQDFKIVTEDIFKKDFPYVILRTQQKDPDPTKNFLYVNAGNEDIYQIIANEYIFLLAFEAVGSIETMNIFINQSNNKVRMGLLSVSSWESLRQGMYNHAASIANKNADKMNNDKK